MTLARRNAADSPARCALAAASERSGCLAMPDPPSNTRDGSSKPSSGPSPQQGPFASRHEAARQCKAGQRLAPSFHTCVPFCVPPPPCRAALRASCHGLRSYVDKNLENAQWAGAQSKAPRACLPAGINTVTIHTMVSLLESYIHTHTYTPKDTQTGPESGWLWVCTCVSTLGAGRACGQKTEDGVFLVPMAYVCVCICRGQSTSSGYWTHSHTSHHSRHYTSQRR